MTTKAAWQNTVLKKAQEEAQKIDTVDRWNATMIQFLTVLSKRVFPQASHPNENNEVCKFIGHVSRGKTQEQLRPVAMYLFVKAIKPFSERLLNEFNVFMTEDVPQIPALASLGIASHWQQFSADTQTPIAIFILGLYIGGDNLVDELFKRKKVGSHRVSDSPYGKLEEVFSSIDFNEVLPDIIMSITAQDIRLMTDAVKSGAPDEAALRGLVTKILSNEGIRKVMQHLHKANASMDGGLNDIIANISDDDLQELMANMLKQPMMGAVLSQLGEETTTKLLNLKGEDVRKMLSNISNDAVGQMLGAAGTGDTNLLFDAAKAGVEQKLQSEKQ